MGSFHGCCAKHPLGLSAFISQMGQPCGYGSYVVTDPWGLGFPRPYPSHLRRAQIPPVSLIADGHTKFGVWILSISSCLFLDIDVKEVGGELMGEGLAVGPTVPASQPPIWQTLWCDTNLVFFMLFPSARKRWENYIKRPSPPSLHSCCWICLVRLERDHTKPVCCSSGPSEPQESLVIYPTLTGVEIRNMPVYLIAPNNFTEINLGKAHQ